MPCRSPAALLSCAWSSPFCGCPAGICSWSLRFEYLFSFLLSLIRSWWSLLLIQLHLYSHWSCRPPKTSSHCHFAPDSGGPLQFWLWLKDHSSCNNLLKLSAASTLTLGSLWELQGSFHDLGTLSQSLPLYWTMWYPQVIARGSYDSVSQCSYLGVGQIPDTISFTRILSKLPPHLRLQSKKRILRHSGSTLFLSILTPSSLHNPPKRQ